MLGHNVPARADPRRVLLSLPLPRRMEPEDLGWRVHNREDNELSARPSSICEAEGADPKKLVLHSDNGRPIKGAAMVATLESLGVTRSLSRPSVSNDNPFVESTFRTVKDAPASPTSPLKASRPRRLRSRSSSPGPTKASPQRHLLRDAGTTSHQRSRSAPRAS